MAIDLKVETADTTLDVATALLMGADSQSDARPSIYPAVRLSNALATEAKTLTNKTLTSPVVNTLVHASGGVMTVPNATGTIARLEDISSGSYTSPMVSRGQMLRRGASADEAFSKGTVGYVVMSGSNDPDWYDMGMVSVKLYGATGDGATDDTAAIQACIDANKGRTIFFPAGDYVVGGTTALILNGATYDNTTLVGSLEAQIIMAVRPSTATNNYSGFGSGWAGLIVKDTYGVALAGLTFNGQRTLQPPSEFAHTLILAGVERTRVYGCKFYELRGDGIYLSQSDLSASSTNARHVELYDNEFWNDEPDGRNAISIAGCDDGIIKGFKSYNVGGTILYPVTTVTCTVTTASPAVFTKSAHGFAENTALSFDTSGTMPTGLSNSRSGKIYYVIATGLTANEFQVSLTPGGTAVNVTGAGTGTLSVNTGTFVPEPGGIDIEPNDTYQSNKRWVISDFNITHAGTTGLAIHGRPGGTETTRDIAISNGVLTNTDYSYKKDATSGTYSYSDHAGNLTVLWADNVTIDNVVCRFTNTYGMGPIIGDSVGIKIKASVDKVYTGATIGATSYDDPGAGSRGVQKSEIDIRMTSVCRFGFSVGNINRVKVKGDVATPVASYFPTGLFAVVATTNAFVGVSQTDSQYEVSVETSTLWTRSYRSAAGATPTYTRVWRQNCDLGANDSSGWTAAVNQIGDMQIRNRNVAGVTNRASIPTAGAYAAGDFVVNDGAAIGTPSANKILQGWQRVTTGTAHSAGTDWHLCVVANS